MKEEGWLALYRGILPALFLTSHGAVQFVVYEKLKELRPPSTDAGRSEALVYGGVSKLAAATATYPYQVVKTRVQQRYPNTNSSFKGNLPAGEVARTFRCVGDALSSRGSARVLRAGCWPTRARVAPSRGADVLDARGGGCCCCFCFCGASVVYANVRDLHRSPAAGPSVGSSLAEKKFTPPPRRHATGLCKTSDDP